MAVKWVGTYPSSSYVFRMSFLTSRPPPLSFALSGSFFIWDWDGMDGTAGYLLTY